MANTTPDNQEMTDVLSRLPNLTLPSAESAEFGISDRKKAMLSTASVLLGGGAAFAAVNYDALLKQLSQDKEAPKGIPPIETSNAPAPDNATVPDGNAVKADPISAPVKHHHTSAVQSGEITPGDAIVIASRVDDGMTFGQAFAAAREEVGLGGIFSWRGEVYNTYYLKEWQGLSLGQRQEFLSEVGFRSHGQPTPDLAPAIFEFVIGGRPAIGVDDDHDGVADAILFLDEETNDMIAFMDTGGDDRIDTVYRFDAYTDRVVGVQPIEEPFLVDVNRLEAFGSGAYESAGSDLFFAVNDDKTSDDDYSNGNDDSGYVNDAEMPDMD